MFLAQERMGVGVVSREARVEICKVSKMDLSSALCTTAQASGHPTLIVTTGLGLSMLHFRSRNTYLFWAFSPESTEDLVVERTPGNTIHIPWRPSLGRS